MCAKNCANAAKMCFICGDVRRRASYRLRYRMMCAAMRRMRVGRAAPLRKSRRIAPIMGGIRRYHRRNAFGNIQLPPVVIDPRPIYVAPRLRRPRFKKIFNKARPSQRFEGDANFNDLGIVKSAVTYVLRLAKKIKTRTTKLNDLDNFYMRANVFRYMCEPMEFLQLQYIKAFYVYLNTSHGKYVRTFGPRSFEWLDLNNKYDPWLEGWRFEILDEIWYEIRRRIPENIGLVNYYDYLRCPGRIPMKRIWRKGDYVTDESVKQIIRYLIEETIDAAYWNMAYALIL